MYRFSILGVVIAAMAAPAAFADSTNAVPMIGFGSAAYDVSKLPWIDAQAKAILEKVKSDFEAGKVNAYAVAAAPDGTWAYRVVSAGTVAPSLTDVVRQTLEACEYRYGAPCRLVAVNNRTTELPDGGWADQPRMLSDEAARIDPDRVPFVPETERMQMREYKAAPGPKALALADDGSWAWRSGKTPEEAIQAAVTACEGQPPVGECKVYALNDFVVMELHP